MTAENKLNLRRKRLLFRSWHRGTREMDLILGRFADAMLASLDAEQLDRFAALLENSDPDLHDWLTRRAVVPPAHDHDVMKLLQNFSLSERND